MVEKIRENKAKAILIGVVSLVIIILIILVCVRFTDAKAIATNNYYTEEQLEEIRLEAFNEGLGDKEKYIREIEELKAEIIRVNNEWQEKYDNMVIHYEAIIADLHLQLQERQEYTRMLEKYIIESNDEFLDESNLLDVLELQLSAYKLIKTGGENDLKYWQTVLDNLPSLDVLYLERANHLNSYSPPPRPHDDGMNDYLDYVQEKITAAKKAEDWAEVAKWQAEYEKYLPYAIDWEAYFKSVEDYEKEYNEQLLEIEHQIEATQSTKYIANYQVVNLTANISTLNIKINELQNKINQLKEA